MVKMTPGTALRLIAMAVPMNSWDDELEEAFSVLHDLASKAVDESESL